MCEKNRSLATRKGQKGASGVIGELNSLMLSHRNTKTIQLALDCSIRISYSWEIIWVKMLLSAQLALQTSSTKYIVSRVVDSSYIFDVYLFNL